MTDEMPFVICTVDGANQLQAAAPAGSPSTGACYGCGPETNIVLMHPNQNGIFTLDGRPQQGNVSAAHHL